MSKAQIFSFEDNLRIQITTIVVTIFSLFVGGCGNNNSTPDFVFIDKYLQNWDRFAQGANELVPQLKQETPRFQHQLAEAIVKGDKRAPSRLVFYAVVQVGGYVNYNSELGQACKTLFGGEVPTITSKTGEKLYYAGDIYVWWKHHQKEYESFALFEEWSQRDFAKKKVIPFYERQQQNR